MSSAYKVDRKTASDLLNVSERTLDRYIRSGRLTFKKMGRKVLLSEKELQRLSAEMGSEETINTVDIVSEAPASSDTTTIARVDEGGTKVRGDIYMKVENIVYKNLFEKATKEIEHKDDDIKMLNYKLGKLETQIKNTVPLLDFRRSEDSVAKLKAQHKKEIEEKETRIEETVKMYNTERINKFVYLSILGAFAGISVVTWIVQAMFA